MFAPLCLLLNTRWRILRGVTFIDRLERQRQALGLGHVAYAQYLGVSRAYWSLVRRGVKPVTDGFIGRVVSTHPELAQLLTEGEEELVAA